MDLHEMSWKGSPDDAWILANWHPRHIRSLYCDSKYWGKDALEWESIRQYRKRNKKFLDRFKGMEKPTPFEDIGQERERVKHVRNVAPKVGQTAAEHTVMTVPVEAVPYLEQVVKALDKEGALSKVRFSEYQMGYKDADGEARVKDLKAFRFEVDFDAEPKWIPVNRVESVKLRKKESLKQSEAKRAVILPDLQIPYQDEQALEVALNIIRDVKPDKIILLGDMLDLEAFGKFDNLPSFAGTTQDAIIRAHKLLVELRKISPTAEIAVLEGNHDLRLQTHINKNAKAAFGLRRADMPEGWPVLSVPYLCAFDDLDVEYIAGYPANRYWINKNLQVKHGNKVRSGGSTAKAVSDDERSSIIFGHVHRLETQYKTHHTYEGGKTNAAFGIGCLCKLDGSVPSVNRGVDLQGRRVENYENWQNAICVVDYEEGDGSFNVNPVYINTFNNYKAIYNGRQYEASL